MPVFRTPPKNPRVPLLDLETVRDTLTYIHDDLKRTPGFEAASQRLDEAIAAIKTAEKNRQVIPSNILTAQFLRRPRN
jgi:hypothetical protein